MYDNSIRAIKYILEMRDYYQNEDNVRRFGYEGYNTKNASHAWSKQITELADIALRLFHTRDQFESEAALEEELVFQIVKQVDEIVTDRLRGKTKFGWGGSRLARSLVELMETFFPQSPQLQSIMDRKYTPTKISTGVIRDHFDADLAVTVAEADIECHIVHHAEKMFIDDFYNKQKPTGTPLRDDQYGTAKRQILEDIRGLYEDDKRAEYKQAVVDGAQAEFAARTRTAPASISEQSVALTIFGLVFRVAGHPDPVIRGDADQMDPDVARLAPTYAQGSFQMMFNNLTTFLMKICTRLTPAEMKPQLLNGSHEAAEAAKATAGNHQDKPDSLADGVGRQTGPLDAFGGADSAGNNMAPNPALREGHHPIPSQAQMAEATTGHRESQGPSLLSAAPQSDEKPKPKAPAGAPATGSTLTVLRRVPKQADDEPTNRRQVVAVWKELADSLPGARRTSGDGPAEGTAKGGNGSSGGAPTEGTASLIGSHGGPLDSAAGRQSPVDGEYVPFSQLTSQPAQPAEEGEESVPVQPPGQ